MDVNPSIFKAYDIRGIYPTELDENIAYAIGRAFAAYLQADRVVLGRDMRLSGPALCAAAGRGLMDAGVEVLDIGMVSTDQYYFACAHSGLPGMMTTASHNPKQYNGFKMVRRMPYLLSGEDGIQEIRRRVEQDDLGPLTGLGRRVTADYQADFLAYILALIDVNAVRPLHIIADTGNGMVGPVLQKVFAKLPVHLTGMYLEPDGSLPNHGLDPLQPANRAELQARVAAEGADLGLAFDGDGDRFFVIDDRGHFAPGDFLTALMGRYLLEKHPAAKIIYDVRASWAVPDTIHAAGGTPLMERVGHAFIKRRMADENALFAGEVTGHYYFRSFFYADSGLVPALTLIEMLSRSGKKLSEMLQPLEEKYFISGEINSIVADAPACLAELAACYPDAHQYALDGLSVEYPDWHFNVRPSNTEPLLRLNLEALTQADMERHRDEALAVIRGG